MFGFLAFNGGSTGEISTKGVGQIVAKVMVNTILCGAFAALSYLFVHFIRKGKWTILLTINACLTGMFLINSDFLLFLVKKTRIKLKHPQNNQNIGEYNKKNKTRILKKNQNI